jgi:hypothetical protein
MFRDRSTYGGGDLVCGGPSAGSFDFGYDDQSFVSLVVDGKCRAAGGPDRRVAIFDSLLDILRIVISSAQNDQVLDASSYKQLPIVHKSQVASPQVRAASVRSPGLKRRLTQFRLTPITLSYAWTANPDFSRPIGWTNDCRLWIDDGNLLIQERRSTTNDRPRFAVVGAHHFDPVLLEGRSRNRQCHWRMIVPAAGHNER